jgi:hypothetical protein
MGAAAVDMDAIDPQHVFTPLGLPK